MKKYKQKSDAELKLEFPHVTDVNYKIGEVAHGIEWSTSGSVKQAHSGKIFYSTEDWFNDMVQTSKLRSTK